MVRDLVGTRHIQGADCALLVTTSRFTAQGYAEVAEQPVELWDGDDLAEQIRRADALRDDPLRAQARRRRTTFTLLALLMLNSSALLWALLTAGLPTVAATTPLAPTRLSVVTTPLPRRAEPVQSSQPPMPTEAPASEPITARVTNGGNVRAAPSLQGAVRGQIHANQTVELLGRTTDGVWLHISAGPQLAGWTHQSLLRLDPLMVQRLPVLTHEALQTVHAVWNAPPTETCLADFMAYTGATARAAQPCRCARTRTYALSTASTVATCYRPCACRKTSLEYNTLAMSSFEELVCL